MSATIEELSAMMTLEDAAKWGRCTEQHIRNLIKRGQFPRPIYLGGLARWPRAELAEWLRSNFIAANPAPSDTRGVVRAGAALRGNIETRG
jgi:predicted DNA-binding transcriptional regulator AlpA